MKFLKINEHYTETDCKRYRITDSPNSARPHQIYFKGELIGSVRTKPKANKVIKENEKNEKQNSK